MSKQRKKSLGRKLIITIVSAFLVILLYLFLILHQIFGPNKNQKAALSDSTYAAKVLFPEDHYPTLKADPVSGGKRTNSTPKICLIIDDFGNNWAIPEVQELLAFPVPLTIAIIPGLWASDSIAIRAHGYKKDVIAHVPMAPTRKIKNKEKLFLDSEMGRDSFESFMSQIRLLPYSIGLNNHMGSLATQDKYLMNLLAQWCKREGWMMLDSITHPDTKLYSAAQEVLVPCLKRDIFLDHNKDVKSVEASLERAAQIAKKRGGRPVIVIGHPRAATLEVLKNKVPSLLNEGFEFISLSQAVKLESD